MVEKKTPSPINIENPSALQPPLSSANYLE